MIKEIIEVEISNIEVDTKYFSFNYKIKRNDNVVIDSSYSDDHSWNDEFDKFQKILENSLAVELALDNFPCKNSI